MTTWLWMGWKTNRCCIFTDILLLIATGKQQGLGSGCAANVAGFSLHAGVMSNAQDRCKLERLCRYITRYGVPEKRLTMTTHGKVRYPLKTPYRDGNNGDRRSHMIFELLDFNTG